jgi:processive 1,2-diacylglycerol beta-glucosyltransferase/1,2-diacylglycerol 3-beta-galactosyltransferase
VKRRLGFDPTKKVVLIIGGGDGIPKGRTILRRIVQLVPIVEVAIVCGYNRALYRAATRLKSRRKLDNLKIFSYIDFVHELLSVSDIVITKCGASTFMQILLSQKIPIVNSYLWEQEKGTVEFLKACRVGVYEKKVRKLPSLIHRLVTDPKLYSYYQRNIAALSMENGTSKVAEFLVNFQTSSKINKEEVYESHR